MSYPPKYPLCAVCNRFPRGFGYHDPRFRMWSQMGQQSLRSFCSSACQQTYSAIKQHYGEEAMIDPTAQEMKAMHSVIEPLSEYIDAEIGWETPLGDYDRHEIMSLIEVVVTAYHDALLKETANRYPDAAPYDPKSSIKQGG